MNHIIRVFAFAFIFSGSLWGQPHLSYSYDDAGNRTSVEILTQLVDDDGTVGRILGNSFDAALTSTGEVKRFEKNDFSLFPNPSSTILNISSKLEGNYRAVLQDPSGKRIREIDLSREVEVDVSDLVSGTYYLIISAADGRHQIYKVMKI